MSLIRYDPVWNAVRTTLTVGQGPLGLAAAEPGFDSLGVAPEERARLVQIELRRAIDEELAATAPASAAASGGALRSAPRHAG